MKSGANRPQVFNQNKISGEKLTLSGGKIATSQAKRNQGNLECCNTAQSLNNINRSNRQVLHKIIF